MQDVYKRQNWHSNTALPFCRWTLNTLSLHDALPIWPYSEQEQEIIVRIIKMLIRQLRGTSKFQLFSKMCIRDSSYPDRICSSFDRLDFTQCTNLTFEQPDTKRFRNRALAYEAM